MTTIDKVFGSDERRRDRRKPVRTRRSTVIGLIAAVAILTAACGSSAASTGNNAASTTVTGDTGESTGTTGAVTDTSNPDSTESSRSSDDDDATTTGGQTSGATDVAGDPSDSDDDGQEPEALSDDELAKAEAAAAEFSQCVRDEGVDMPDLGILEDGSLDLTGMLASVDPQDPTVKRAILACQRSLRSSMIGSLNRLLNSGTFDDVLEEFSECVEDQGYAVKSLSLASVMTAMLIAGPGPDPRGIDGSVDPILARALGLDPDDVDVLNAVDACAAGVQADLAALDLGDLGQADADS